MKQGSDSGKEKHYQSYLNTHLKDKEQRLPTSGKVRALKRRNRSKRWQLLVNITAILFLIYSFYYDIIGIGDTLLIVLVLLFFINTGLLYYQIKQIRYLIKHLQDSRDEE